MTITQIIGLVTKCGYDLYLRDDGTPALKPNRKGAKLVGRLEQQLKDNRTQIIGWLNSARKNNEGKCQARVLTGGTASFLVCTCCQGRSVCKYPEQLGEDIEPATPEHPAAEDARGVLPPDGNEVSGPGCLRLHVP